MLSSVLRPFLVLLACCWAVSVLAETLPSTHYKYVAIRDICQKITEAHGRQIKTPHLVVYSVDNGKQVIAQFKNTPIPTIYIDEKIYDLSRRFGKDSLDALACIVGHELAHLFEKHSFSIGMTGMMGLVDANTGGKALSKQDKVSLESQADYYGLFYGYLAGYKTFQLLPQMLDLIYKEYKLPESLDGYPSKKERIATATTAITELSQITTVLNVGEILYLQKQYDDAAIAFEYLLQKFPSRDIYNNLATIRINQASKLFNNEELYFAYPYEFDAVARLRAGTERSGGGNTEQAKLQRRRELLKEAKQHLKRAILLDANYLTAYINLACIYALEGNYELAIGTMNEAETLCHEQNITFSGNAYLIRAIARVRSNQWEQAEKDFEQAVSKKATLAKYNYELYKQMKSSWTDKMMNWVTDWKGLTDWVQSWTENNQEKTMHINPNLEKICQQNITESSQKTVFDQEMTVNDNNKTVKISSQKEGSCEKLKIKLFDKDLFLLMTAPNYVGNTARGIVLNDNVEKLTQQYGQPSYIVGCNGADFYFYEQANLIMRVAQRKVKGWVLYKIKYR